MPIVRTFVPVVAGAAGMDYRQIHDLQRHWRRRCGSGACCSSGISWVATFRASIEHIETVIIVVIVLSLLPGRDSLGQSATSGRGTDDRIPDRPGDRYGVHATRRCRTPANALEPHIDAKTMEIHHGKHHQAYVTNLNTALEKAPELPEQVARGSAARQLNSVPEAVRTAVRNNGGGHWNHSMFWELDGPEAPAASLAASWPTRSRPPSATSRSSRSSSPPRASGASDPAGSGCSTTAASSRSPARRTRTTRSWTASPQRRSSRPRRVGARLLPQVPEPPPGLHQGVVERGELEGGRKAVRLARDCRWRASTARSPVRDGRVPATRSSMPPSPGASPGFFVATRAVRPVPARAASRTSSRAP